MRVPSALRAVQDMDRHPEGERSDRLRTYPWHPQPGSGRAVFAAPGAGDSLCSRRPDPK